MSKLRFRISMSLDGYVAGPEQSKQNPLGIGGEGLHDWVVALAAWRHVRRPSRPLERGQAVERVVGGRSALSSSGVRPDPSSAPAARAEGRDHVHLVTGGASVANQYLSAGLVDEMEIHLVPMLLGGGERLFAGLEDLKGLRPVRTVAAPGVTHLKFSRS